MQKTKAIDFLSKQTAASPFLAIVSPPAPHEPFTAAKRHEAAFKNINALRTPSFNIESGELDKHWLVRMPPAPLPQATVDTIDEYYRKRWQTLLAVDELVEAVVTQLKTSGLYDNTYIIFTSDNGYHLGQFSMPYDKRQPYETDIRVPFFIVGPNIKQKIVVDNPIVLLDLAPTIYNWARVDEPQWLDGESFAAHLTEQNDVASGDGNSAEGEEYERKFLVQYWGEGTESTYNPDCPWRRNDRLSVRIQ